MPDKEIKEAKSLRWLANQFPKVENPKDNSDRLCNCINLYCTNAAELIERLQAENERLNGCVKTEDEVRAIANETIQAGIKTIKAEAYKECIEKVKEYIDTHEHLSCEECECVPISKNGLDNLLKELVGEENVS